MRSGSRKHELDWVERPTFHEDSGIADVGEPVSSAAKRDDLVAKPLSDVAPGFTLNQSWKCLDRVRADESVPGFAGSLLGASSIHKLDSPRLTLHSCRGPPTLGTYPEEKVGRTCLLATQIFTANDGSQMTLASSSSSYASIRGVATLRCNACQTRSETRTA